MVFSGDCTGGNFTTNRGNSGRTDNGNGGGSNQERLITGDEGTLTDSSTWECDFTMTTDTNPGGEQSFNECGYFIFNSGVTAKFTFDGRKRSVSTNDDGDLIMCVVNADTSEDCDRDGISDSDELTPGDQDAGGPDTDQSDPCDCEDPVSNCP